MKVVYDLMVILHLLGMAALVGGWMATIGSPRMTPLMLWAARLQLITGLVIVGLAESVDSFDQTLDHNKIGLKLLVAIAVVGFAEVARGREKRGNRQAGLVNAAGYLAILNVVIAVCWH